MTYNLIIINLILLSKRVIWSFMVLDYVMNEAGKILRLLHIRELRELQTRINEAIVAAQAITANPKTDERLGKVGK